MIINTNNFFFKFIKRIFSKKNKLKEINLKTVELKEENKIKKYWYTKKEIMTYTEKRFYKIFKSILKEDYIIIPQLSLNSIIRKNHNNYYKRQNELNRTIDFGILKKDTFELLLLIEINDETHNRDNKRKIRDMKVNELCNKVGYKIIRFWLNKPNEYAYIKSRLYENLNIKEEEIEILDI